MFRRHRTQPPRAARGARAIESSTLSNSGLDTQARRVSLKSVDVFLFGAMAYAVFLATFLYAIGFIGNFGVPKTMDSPSETPWQDALLIDAGLLALFALQHSLMARPFFKKVLTRLIPVPATIRLRFRVQ